MKAFLVDSVDANRAIKDDISMFVKEKLHRFSVRNNFFLIDEFFCYGIIKVKKFVKLGPIMFDNTSHMHGLTDKDKITRWLRGNKSLYGYVFEFIDLFKTPKPILLEKQDKDFTDVFVIKEHISRFNDMRSIKKYLIDDLSTEMTWDALNNMYILSLFFNKDYDLKSIIKKAITIKRLISVKNIEKTLLFQEIS